MGMHKTTRIGVCLTLGILLLSGCGDKPDGSGQAGQAAPTAAVPAADVPEVKAAEDLINPLDNPGMIRTLLVNREIPNGDIYLQDDKVHVNIVGLNEEVERIFADTCISGTYVLHDIKYSHRELEAAQKLLYDHNLYHTFNLYGSSIDVIHNKLQITMPDSSEAAARPEIEKLMDPGMLDLIIEPLGEPHVVGTIVEINDQQGQKILILEPDQEQPTYWFSFQEVSELYNAHGEEIQFSELKKGQSVKLWSTGTVNQSLPAQATVRRIETDAEDQ